MLPLLLRVIAIVALCIATGCALMNSRAPSKDHKPSAPPRCSTSSGSIAADVIFGSLAGAVGIGAMADGESAGSIGLLAGAAFIGSAAAGISWGSKCTKQHKAHAVWLSERENRIEERAAMRRRARRLRQRQLRIERAAAAEDEQPRSPYTPVARRSEPPAAAKRPAATKPTTPTPPTPPAPPAQAPSWPQRDWSEFWRQVNR